jgi:mannose-1-phosphate guanylyltransferase
VADSVADGPIVIDGLLEAESSAVAVAVAVAEAEAVAESEAAVGVAMDVVPQEEAATAAIRQASALVDRRPKTLTTGRSPPAPANRVCSLRSTSRST